MQSQKQQAQIVQLPTQQQTRRELDEDGDEILIEGICDKKSVYLGVAYRVVCVSVISLLGTLIAIPLGIAIAKAAVKSFRLYLTKKSIHYHQAYPDCGLGVKTLVISLSDITGVASAGTDVWLYMEPEKIVRFLGGSMPVLECWSACVPRYLLLSNVKNSVEFVEAVQREIS